MSDKTFKNKTLITKSENELIETLISNDTKIHNYKNKIELIQKLGDGNIIVISRKTIGNLDSTHPKKVNKITTINLIEESYDDDCGDERLKENEVNNENKKEVNENKDDVDNILLEEKNKTINKINEEAIVKPRKRKVFNFKGKNNYNFAKEIKRNEFVTVSDTIKSNDEFINNNFNNMSNELKPNVESDIFETHPDSIKMFDIHSIVDSVADNKKIRVTRSKTKNVPHSSYFLSQLNDVKNVSSVRVRYMDFNKRLEKKE